MALAHELDISDQSHDLSPESRGESFGEVVRDYQPTPTTKWRFGKPNYARVNQAYFEGRSKKHPEGSLESVVSKIVKNWEVESHHIYDIKDWQTMDVSVFDASVNGGTVIDAQVMADVGPYNMLLGDVDGYKASDQTFESANKIFSGVFTEGFAWECLEVYSPPPEVAFRWRHFGKFSGSFTDSDGETHQGNGKMINVYGACIAKVNTSLKIESLKVYYDPKTQIEPLLTNKHPKAAAAANSAGMCPFAPMCSRSRAADDVVDDGITKTN